MQHFFDQAMYGTDTVDYALTVSNDKDTPYRGYRDQNGKPALAKGDDPREPQHSEITVRRVGEFILPVTVRVKFEDGSTTEEHWDGQYRWKKFYYPGKKVASATVDPDWKWKLEVPRIDNTYVAQQNTLAADKWYLRWVVWIENALNAFAYFS
jgi:hypothetical protein